MNETPEEKAKRIDSANQYQSYMRGWRDGAGTHAMRKEFSECEDLAIRAAYDLGYAHGYAARCGATDLAVTKYDHTPSILRVAEES